MARYTRFLVVLIVVVGGAAVAASAGPTVDPDTAAGALGSAGAPPTDNTVTRIEVERDGDARWTVKIRTRLATEEDLKQYRAFQQEFRNNTSQFLGPFAERIRGVVGQAANDTTRNMSATNFTATTSIQEVPRRWGIVAFSFQWSNAARQEGDTLVLGDVFQGGYFLAANDTLIVAAPPEYVVRNAVPRPDSNETTRVSWTGREDFADGRPRVVLRPRATPSATPTAISTPSATAGADTPGGLALVGLALVGVVVVAVVVVVRTGMGSKLWGASQSGGGDGSDERGGGAAGDVAAVLTDAERVEQLLAANGGRMKQAAVAEELEWSDSKTSRVVGTMVEEGRVEKLRIGRENVLDLEADSSRSP